MSQISTHSHTQIHTVCLDVCARNALSIFLEMVDLKIVFAFLIPEFLAFLAKIKKKCGSFFGF